MSAEVLPTHLNKSDLELVRFLRSWRRIRAPAGGQRDLIDFLVAEIGRIPGIVSMETAIGLKPVKA